MTYYGKFHVADEGDHAYYVGDTPMLKKAKNPFNQAPSPAVPVQAEEVAKHQTLMPHSHGRKNGIDQITQKEPKVGEGATAAPAIKKNEEGMHRHQGHPETHPQRLRHRKISADPLHKEEDGLVDEWRDLYDKAMKGECTPIEMQRLQEIRGRVDELNASRATDAERILGIAMKSMDRVVRKAEEVYQPRQVVAESPKEDQTKLTFKDESWRNREAEYGDPEDDLDILPDNKGFKDEVDRSESVWGTAPKNDLVHVSYPNEVKDAPVASKKAPEPALDTSTDSPRSNKRTESGAISIPKEYKGKVTKAQLGKAIQVTKTVESMLLRDWGNFPSDDGRFSDPFFIAKFIAQGNEFPNLKKAKDSMTTLFKHNLPGSPHWEHMTNGGGWGVKLNPKTRNFVAYQREDGDMTKREAQTDAIARNKKNKGEKEGNDKVDEALNPKFARPPQ